MSTIQTQSRKVAGFIMAVARYVKVKREMTKYSDNAAVRYGNLTGTQIAEAKRIMLERGLVWP